MTSPMYKDGVEMEVTDDKDGRAELAKHGWTEKPAEAPKKRGRPKKVKDDDCERDSI